MSKSPDLVAGGVCQGGQSPQDHANGSGLLLPRVEGGRWVCPFLGGRAYVNPVCIWWEGACPELVKAPYVSGLQTSLVSPSVSLQGCLSAMQWSELLDGDRQKGLLWTRRDVCKSEQCQGHEQLPFHPSISTRLDLPAGACGSGQGCVPGSVRGICCAPRCGRWQRMACVWDGSWRDTHVCMEMPSFGF